METSSNTNTGPVAGTDNNSKAYSNAGDNTCIDTFIVVVTYNSEDFIEKCISSITGSDYKKWFLAVIDNKSSDDTVKKICNLSDGSELQGSGNFKLISLKKNTGFAGAVNHAVFKYLYMQNAALAENIKYLVLINPDLVLEKDSISNLIGALSREGSAGAVSGIIYDYDKKSIQNAGGMIRDNFITYHLDEPPQDTGLPLQDTAPNQGGIGSYQGEASLQSRHNALCPENTNPHPEDNSLYPQDTAPGPKDTRLYPGGGDTGSYRGEASLQSRHNAICPDRAGTYLQNPGLYTVDYTSGALLALHIEIFLKLKGFDTGYRPLYFEELDFCLKLKSLGALSLISRRVFARHFEGASVKKFSRNFYRHYHKNRIRCVIINSGFTDFFKKFLPAEIKWLKNGATLDQQKAIISAYFLNFLFFLYNLTVRLKNNINIKHIREVNSLVPKLKFKK